LLLQPTMSNLVSDVVNYRANSQMVIAVGGAVDIPAARPI
jgi:hypothetical protein